MENSSLTALQKFMGTTPPGNIVDTARIEDLLASCWEQLQRHRGGMRGYKLLGRMEDVKWNPPILRFVIERHGGTVLGSGYAELQSWAVDVNAGRATLDERPRKRGWAGRGIARSRLAPSLPRSLSLSKVGSLISA